MAIKAIAGGTQCGRKSHSTEFTGTGPLKGHFPVYVCDSPQGHSGAHRDKASGKKWSDR